MSRRALILLGPPGAGKGTQARKLEDRFKYPSISTGDVLRNAVKKGTPLGRKARGYMESGNLVPDSLVDEIVKSRLNDEDCRAGFILDGYPRTISQAEFFAALAAEEGMDPLAVGIIVDDQAIVDRLSGRRTCPSCGKIYNVHFNPSRVEARCDECGAELTQRKDDSPEVVRERLQVYHRTTQPLIDFYEARGRYVGVNGEQSVDAIFNDILGILEGRKDDSAAGSL